MPTYLPFDPNPRRPRSCRRRRASTASFTCLGPLEKYPVRPGAAYQMPTATWEAALRVHKTLGIERGIIVQTTTYGADHSVVLDALAAMGPNYRACANALVFRRSATTPISPSCMTPACAAPASASAGARRRAFGQATTSARSRRIRELGWYAKIQPEKDGIVSSRRQDTKLSRCRSSSITWARPEPTLGKNDPNLRAILELLSKGNFWVMLSLGEKTSKKGPPWDDVVPIAQAYLEAAPDRCVWASDWPHPYRSSSRRTTPTCSNCSIATRRTMPCWKRYWSQIRQSCLGSPNR